MERLGHVTILESVGGASDLRLMDVQRQAKVTEKEAEDDEAAHQAHRMDAERRAISGSGAGRPKKTKAELLADVAKLVRDRAHMIQDNVDKVKRGMDDLLTEIKEVFKNNNGYFVFNGAFLTFCFQIRSGRR